MCRPLGTIASNANTRHCAGSLHSSVGKEGNGVSEVVNVSLSRLAKAFTRKVPRARFAGGVTFTLAY